MSYNAKNYTEQGGDVTHIGGKLIIEEKIFSMYAKGMTPYGGK